MARIQRRAKKPSYRYAILCHPEHARESSPATCHPEPVTCNSRRLRAPRRAVFACWGRQARELLRCSRRKRNHLPQTHDRFKVIDDINGQPCSAPESREPD
jgi:hypothetical protein